MLESDERSSDQRVLASRRQVDSEAELLVQRVEDEPRRFELVGDERALWSQSRASAFCAGVSSGVGFGLTISDHTTSFALVTTATWPFHS